MFAKMIKLLDELCLGKIHVSTYVGFEFKKFCRKKCSLHTYVYIVLQKKQNNVKLTRKSFYLNKEEKEFKFTKKNFLPQSFC